MYRITSKIKISALARIAQRRFINQQTDPTVDSLFNCCSCDSENKFSIVPYESGFPFVELYQNENVLSIKTILENGMASKTSEWTSYLGKYTVIDLPTLYFGTSCRSCSAMHLLVFGFGEKQPGLTICEISGVWKVDLVSRDDA